MFYCELNFLPRHPDQVFVWNSMESPITMKDWFGYSMEKFDKSFINWTMSYREDSDVFQPYARGEDLRRHVKNNKGKVDEIVAAKSRVAVKKLFFSLFTLI